jgi:hypothetical protein
MLGNVLGMLCNMNNASRALLGSEIFGCCTSSCLIGHKCESRAFRIGCKMQPIEIENLLCKR